MAVGGWILVNGLSIAVSMLFQDGWFFYSNKLQTAAQCFFHISDGLQTAIAMQIAVWWQWRSPHQSMWWQLATLNLLFSVVGLVGAIPQYALVDFGESFLTILVICFGFLILSVPIYLLAMQIPSQFWQFHLVDRSTLKVTTEEGNLSCDVSRKPTGWSVKGLFAATLLIALMFTLYQAMRRHFTSLSDPTISVFYPSTDFGMLLYQAFSIMTSLVVLWASAWSSLNGGRRVGVIILFAVVAVDTIAELAYMIMLNGYDGVILDMWKETLFDVALSSISIYLMSRWFFARWARAGYRLSGWVRSRNLVVENNT
ncbi:hypothetical protein CA13_45990 [Planctomycetes bacterium CA13]|uniref:Uncharacterized protein n=2 Tax=Novipirellula herctigrandis TaxID=2527986 RepID=A0A5C5Z7U5_9BACT|nr:hypothetical protein CA13_45990 [Planctomycetes bacterium CA13]